MSISFSLSGAQTLPPPQRSNFSPLTEPSDTASPSSHWLKMPNSHLLQLDTPLCNGTGMPSCDPPMGPECPDRYYIKLPPIPQKQCSFLLPSESSLPVFRLSYVSLHHQSSHSLPRLRFPSLTAYLIIHSLNLHLYYN